MLDYFLENIRNIRIVRSREDAEALCVELRRHPWVAYDTEWHEYNDEKTPVYNGLAFSAQFAWFDAHGVAQMAYVHNYGECDGLIHDLAPFFEDAAVCKTAHNAPVDSHIIGNHGIKIVNASYDTMVADHLRDERRENKHGLKECASDFLGHDRAEFNETFGERKRNKNGELSKAGGWIVPTMPEYVRGEACPSLVRALADYAVKVPTDPTKRTPEQQALAEKRESAARWLNLWSYAIADVFDGLRLLEFYKKELSAKAWLGGKTMWDYFLEVSCPLTDLIIRMERHGMPLNLTWLDRMALKAGVDMERYETALFAWAGGMFKPSSPIACAKLLYGHGPQEITLEEMLENPTPRKKKRKVKHVLQGRGYPVFGLTDTGAPSTKAEVLKELRGYLKRTGETDLSGLEALLSWKKAEKQRGTYLVGMRSMAINGRVHGRINQIGTTSHRFSSSNPNLQNITTGDKDVYFIRDAFIALPGWTLIVADYGQLEYRLLAHFSQEPKLLELFRQGWDLHSLTTYNVFPHVKAELEAKFGKLGTAGLKWVAETYPDERKKAKTLNFEIIYGVGHKKLADQLGISESAAKAMIDGWFAGYPNVRRWMNSVIAKAQKGEPLRLLDGVYRHPNMRRINSKDYTERGEEERTLVNAGIQGSAAAIAKKAMLNIDRSEPLRALGFIQLLQVHDEIVGMVPTQNAEAAVELLRPLMEHPFSRPLRVELPVAIGTGKCWSEAKV